MQNSLPTWKSNRWAQVIFSNIRRNTGNENCFVFERTCCINNLSRNALMEFSCSYRSFYLVGSNRQYILLFHSFKNNNYVSFYFRCFSGFICPRNHHLDNDLERKNIKITTEHQIDQTLILRLQNCQLFN